MFRKVDDLEDQLQDMIDSGMMQTSRSYERKEVYHSATMLHEELDRMSSMLSDVANSLNRDFNHNTDGDNVVANIMSVLNAHHISLQSLSEQCESLGRDILMARRRETECYGVGRCWCCRDGVTGVMSGSEYDGEDADGSCL